METGSFPCCYQHTRSPGAKSSVPCQDGFYCKSQSFFCFLPMFSRSLDLILATVHDSSISAWAASCRRALTLACSCVQIARFCSTAAVCHDEAHLLCDTHGSPSCCVHANLPLYCSGWGSCGRWLGGVCYMCVCVWGGWLLGTLAAEK